MSYAAGQIDSKRLIFPGLAGLYESIAPYSYSIIRFIAGAIIVYHGYGKLFGGTAQGVADHVIVQLGVPMPLAWAYFLGLLEFFGGIALAIGLLTRPIALMLTIEFAFITFWWSVPHGYFFTAPGGGYEFPLLLFVLYAAIFFRGGGRLSVDKMIGKEF